MSPATFALIYSAAVSAAAFFAYGADKRRAKRGEYRISERALLALSILGGAAGGLLGMKVFRHKTMKKYFWAVNIIALAAHIAVLITLLRS